jgi:hypothetical protein
MEDFEAFPELPALEPARAITAKEAERQYWMFAKDILLNNPYDGTPFCFLGHHHALSPESTSCYACQHKKETLTCLRWKYFWFVSRLPKCFAGKFPPTFEIWWKYNGDRMTSRIERSLYPIRSEW